MMQNAGALLRWARGRLEDAGIESAHIDARAMLAVASGLSVESLLLKPESLLQPDVEQKLAVMIERRMAKEPLAYIIGNKEFWGLDFVISRPVLVPRPDTESLVELVLSLMSDRKASLRIADFGTGSGCILASLLSEYANASGVGLDISDDAIVVANDNITRLGMSGRARIVKSNWDAALPEDEKFNLIVSNPPYIPSSDIEWLMADVRDFEPHLALVGGEDGFDAYRDVAFMCGRRLCKDGLAVVEAGAGQADGITDIFEKQGFKLAASGHDLQGIERALAFYFDNNRGSL